MEIQTEILTMPFFPLKRSRRQVFVFDDAPALGGVFLAEFGDISASGEYDFGPPASQIPGTTHARITYVQLTADGPGGTFSAEVICDGVVINFEAALTVPGGTTNFIIPALPDQFVAFDVTFNLSSDTPFNIVLYGLWEP